MSDSSERELQADISTRAEILQATFEHFYGIAVAPHDQAATTSNIVHMEGLAHLGDVRAF